MRFALQFDTGNDAFTDDPAGEIARTLRRVANDVGLLQVSISIGVESGLPIRDANGNTIGTWSLK